ncbi:MAG: phage major capsid protein [Hyphomicrobiales bacterium]|nr:MAG: phage major capsid protein [Hyphomicrobiales bacterium]
MSDPLAIIARLRRLAPALKRQIQLSAKKLIAVVYTSGELLEEVALLENHLTRALASEFGFKLDAAIFSGLGTATPLGGWRLRRLSRSRRKADKRRARSQRPT